MAPEVSGSEILSELGLMHVVQVDDANAELMTFERFWEIGIAVRDEAEWATVGVGGLGKFPSNFWRDPVEAHWNGLEEAQQKQLANEVLTITGVLADDRQQEDAGFQSVLRELFPGVDFESITLGQWRERSTNLIQRAMTEATLFLFDLHFERELGTARYGVELLRQNREHEHLTLGLLSHEPSIEDEPKLWLDISEEAQIPQARFVVLSKQRMVPGDSSLFVDGLRRMVLAKVVSELQETCGQILEQSVTEARKAIGAISVYDFDQAIFRSSRIEGVWEGDTFFRLFNATVRQQAQLRMHKSTHLRDQITEIRRKFPLEEPLDTSVQRNAWKLHRQEIYENPDFVNVHLLPIANGDIFQVTADPNQEGSKEYLVVLVAQPCDLAVRANGFRGSVDSPSFSRMAYIVDIPEPPKPAKGLDAASLNAKFDKKNPQKQFNDMSAQLKIVQKQYASMAKRLEASGSVFELPYYEQNGKGARQLEVNRLHHVWLAALDLCALNASGEAELPLDVSVNNDMLLPGWRQRAKMLQDYFTGLLDLVPSCLNASLAKPLQDALLPAACRSRTVNVQVDGADGSRVLKYGVKRVGRIAPDRAAALLASVASQLARPAFEHDLAREKK